jgi:hypothetical protein
MSVNWLWLRSSDLNRNIEKIRGQPPGISIFNDSSVIFFAKSCPFTFLLSANTGNIATSPCGTVGGGKSA